MQIKSLKNPDGAIDAMKRAINKLVQEAPDGAPLKLHILKKPGTASAALQGALDEYLVGKSYAGRFEFVIDAYNNGVL